MRSSVLTAAVLLGLCQAALAVRSIVHLDYATYRGTDGDNSTGVSKWLGIRFAAPPLGDLRFSAPQDPPASHGIIDALTHGPTCLGTASSGLASPQPTNTSNEDCLFLDVYAPSNATKWSNLPVYFFIQGGGFNTNSNANYNGTGLLTASGNNIIVVTFNYRVGPYGFLASQEVLAGGSTNNGLKDQRKALEWVQRYIRRFGGDPRHVVMAGDSAGAASVNLQLTAYGGRDDGLFQATAAESQSFAAVRTVDESQYQYEDLVIRTNCVDWEDTLACLRSLSASDLQTQNFNTPFPGAQKAPLYMYGPVLDYDFVTQLTYAAYADGDFVRVPAIYGDDTNEVRRSHALPVLRTH
jgi:carboxylesterase type B